MTLEEQQSQVSEQLYAMVANLNGKKPKKKTGPTLKTVQRSVELLKEKGIENATPNSRTLVAMYALFYRTVYNLDVTNELCGKDGLGARSMADSFFKREFKSDYKAFCKFMGWCWKREKGREEWRIENAKHGQRINWRMQFSPSMANEYRQAIMRESKFKKQ